MKKKICVVLLAIGFVVVFSGCTGNAESDVKAPSVEKTGTVNVIKDTKTEDADVDVDLTVLSRTMVYSEVYNMMVNPADYVGKTVKMKGICWPFLDEDTGKRYYACIIQDATACCAQGIEFTLTDDYAFPDDYPEEGKTICVVGVFETYEEDGNTYCTLRNAKLES